MTVTGSACIIRRWNLYNLFDCSGKTTNIEDTIAILFIHLKPPFIIGLIYLHSLYLLLVGNKISPKHLCKKDQIRLINICLKKVVKSNELQTNKIIIDREYRFRRYRSTGDIIIYVANTWNKTPETGNEILAVALDISKAFD